MKKILPVVLILVVIAVAGILFLSGRNRGKGAIVLPGEIKKSEGESQEAFTGKLLDAMAKGVPFKCEFSNKGTTGTSFIKGKKYYGEITSEGKTGFIVMEDKCMWTWDKEKKEGAKICMETSPFDENQKNQDSGSEVTEGEYSCKPAVFSDSIFTPPADIKFMEIGKNFGIEQ